MPGVHSIPVGAADKIFRTAAAAGVAQEALCRAVGLDPSAPKDADNRIPFVLLINLYEHAARLTGDASFGLHAGERSNPKMYDVLGYIVTNSRTFGESLNRLLRYQHIWTNAVRFSLDTIGHDVHLSYIYQVCGLSPKERRQESENMLSVLTCLGRLATGVDWVPHEVHFEHAAPSDTSEHERIFRTPVRFKSPITKLIFDSSLLDLPQKEADLTLCRLLERQAEQLLAKCPPRGAFVGQVRLQIEATLREGDTRLVTVSRKMGASSRAFQRKLQAEGVSYRDLVEEVRCELSKFYLQQPEIAICEVAYMLGFSEPSAFHRAFRRWTGITPKVFRKGNVSVRSRERAPETSSVDPEVSGHKS